MPHLADAVRYIEHPDTTEGELRRACAILALDDTGPVDALRQRLESYLSRHDPLRPVACLNPGALPPGLSQAGPRLGRPDPDEHPSVFAAEIALVPDVDDFARMLRDQGDVTRALAATFGEEHAGLRYAPDKWTVREVMGHLSDCERVLSYRLLRALRADTVTLPGFDHVAYVPAGHFEERALASVVDELTAVRQATVALVNGAPVEAFAFRLNVGSGSITGRALAYLIAGHERHHQALLRDRYMALVPGFG